ncbi:MAG: CDP-alcohol phosphatidyltransferase family protein [Gammaproteobacteria bacterium]
MNPKPKRKSFKHEYKPGVIRYIIKPLGQEIVLAIWNTSITPNQVTIFRIILNVLALLCFLGGTFGYIVLGFLLFQVHEVLDTVDGMLAGLKNQRSRLGMFLDVFFDTILSESYTLLGLAIAYGYYRMTDSLICIYLLVFAFIGRSIMASYRHAFRPYLAEKSADVIDLVDSPETFLQKVKVVAIDFLEGCYAWNNQFLLWGALLYYPCMYYFQLNTYVLGFVILVALTHLAWMGVILQVIKNMKKEAGRES